MSSTDCSIPPPTLTFSHRSGVTPYTSSCELAGSCVFGKQLPERLSLRPSKFTVLRQQKEGQALSLTYGRLYAEFLRGKSLVPLGLLALSTSVGLRYGGLTLVLLNFSRKALLKRRPGKFLTFPRRLPTRVMRRLRAKDAKPIRHVCLFPSSLRYDRTAGLEY